MLCVSLSFVIDFIVFYLLRELSVIGVCAKVRMIGFLFVEGMLVNLGNVLKIVSWILY